MHAPLGSMRSLFSMFSIAAVLGLIGSSVACSRAEKPPRTQFVVVPDSFVRPAAAQTQLAPVARGTIRLGEVESSDTAYTPPSAPPAPGAPPTAVGGGPPTGQAQTSVGPMSPTSVTGADSPLDSATTAPPAAGQPGNPLTTGSANTGGGPINTPSGANNYAPPR